MFVPSRDLRQRQRRLNATVPGPGPGPGPGPALAVQTDTRELRPSASRDMQLLHLLLALLAPGAAAGCQGAEVDRQLILAKLRAQFLEYLSPPGPGPQAPQQRRGMHRRHIPGTPALRGRGWGQELDDTSQVILFPTTGVPCEPPQPAELPEDEGVFTYLFQPSPHVRGRLVTSAQLWFYTGPGGAPNGSAAPPDVLLLSGQGRAAVAAVAERAGEQWTVLRFAAPALRYLARELFVLLVRCPGCPCLAEADKTPFLVATTRAKGPDRARRSSVPWSPAALSLLQRPPEDAAAHADCHRAALNISFQELGWEQWIVHPSSFLFRYCHGSCAAGPGLPRALGFQLCCAALPGTMRALRVRTTSDGGYSFKYETVPNILTQDCACI